MLKNIIILPILLAVLILFNACARAVENSPQACWKDRCFDIELAYTQTERERGLQNRVHLDENAGMLFVFQRNEPHAFWMKDTLIPLDMIWLDQQRRVVGIAHEVPPCPSDPCPTYDAPAPSSYVLEINAGLARELGIEPGDTWTFIME